MLNLAPKEDFPQNGNSSILTFIGYSIVYCINISVKSLNILGSNPIRVPHYVHLLLVLLFI